MSEQTANLCTTDAAESLREIVERQARDIERLRLNIAEYNEHERCYQSEIADLKAQAAPVGEREAFETWYLGHFYMGDKQCGLEWLSTEPCGGYRHQHPAEQWIVWQARAALSAPSHGEQVREAVLEELLTRCADWCDKQPKQPWHGRTAGDMVRTFMVCQPLAAAPSACSCGEPDVAGTHRKDGPCYWEPSAPSAGSQEQGE